MISHKDKFIFIHIPKCGGTSIERFILSHYGVSHDWTRKYPLEALPMKVRSEFSIGFGRQQHMTLSNFSLERQKEYNLEKQDYQFHKIIFFKSANYT